MTVLLRGMVSLVALWAVLDGPAGIEPATPGAPATARVASAALTDPAPTAPTSAVMIGSAPTEGATLPVGALRGELLPAVPRALPFFYDLYTFREDDGSTAVVAAIAVQVRRLRGERVSGQTRYRFDLRFFVADTVTNAVFPSIDSVYVNSPSALPRDHLLHTYVEIQAPPSSSTVQRVAVTDASRPGVGELYTTPFPIPDYTGSELMMSDIAFGLPGADTGWTRGDVTLALLPTSQFPESEFDVYYEVYNLPRGHPYETEIAIEPLDEEDDTRRVSAVFTGESAADDDGTLAELRRVQSALQRGSYLLTVTVRNLSTNESTTQSRMVEVRGWERGTTLVRALPRGN